jgi:hypothetical protein
MEKMILNIKDSSKVAFITELINQFDFVEIENLSKKQLKSKGSFFNSAGMWEGRDIDGDSLRKQAWQREK